MKTMEKTLRDIPVLKILLTVNYILLSLTGCDQTSPQSTATAPAKNPTLVVVSVPMPPQRTDNQATQLRSKPIQPPRSSQTVTSSSWVTSPPYDFEEESSLENEAQDSTQLEAEQEKQSLTTQEYADMQVDALLNSPPSPSAWLDKIRERILVEEPEEARASMDAFFLIYPDHPVDESLLDQVYGPE